MDLTGCAIADLRRTVCTSTLSPSRSIYAAPPPASPETRALNARSRPARRRTPRSLRLTPQPVQPPGPPTRVLQRSRNAGKKAPISSGDGISTPTHSLPFCRRSARRSPPRFRPERSSRTTLRLTSPRSCASAISAPRLLRIFRDRDAPSAAPGAGAPEPSLSSKSRIKVVLNCESFDVLPVHGERCALEAVVLAGGQPELRRFYDGDAAGL